MTCPLCNRPPIAVAGWKSDGCQCSYDDLEAALRQAGEYAETREKQVRQLLYMARLYERHWQNAERQLVEDIEKTFDEIGNVGGPCPCGSIKCNEGCLIAKGVPAQIMCPHGRTDACPLCRQPMPPNDVLAVGNVEPVLWLRTLDGKPDWGEDCVGERDSLLEFLDGETDEEIARYDVIPLYAAPPACLSQSNVGGPFTLQGQGPDALDAARYRYLRNVAGQTAEDEDGPMICAGLGDAFMYCRGVECDEIVDAAMAGHFRDGPATRPSEVKP